MRTKFFLLAAAAAATAVLSPAAYAEDLADITTCGFTSTNDPTGAVVQDPTKQTGEVDCGAFVVNTSGGTVTSTTAIACIKVNDDTYGGGVCRSATTAGNFTQLIDTVSYNANVGDGVFFCITIEWTGSKGGGRIELDQDDTKAGAQCGLATSIEA